AKPLHTRLGQCSAVTRDPELEPALLRAIAPRPPGAEARPTGAPPNCQCGPGIGKRPASGRATRDRPPLAAESLWAIPSRPAPWLVFVPGRASPRANGGSDRGSTRLTRPGFGHPR